MFWWISEKLLDVSGVESHLNSYLGPDSNPIRINSCQTCLFLISFLEVDCTWLENKVSHKKFPGCLDYIGDEILPNSIGIIISHYKDPYTPSQVNWKNVALFALHYRVQARTVRRPKTKQTHGLRTWRKLGRNDFKGKPLLYIRIFIYIYYIYLFYFFKFMICIVCKECESSLRLFEGKKRVFFLMHVWRDQNCIFLANFDRVFRHCFL